MYELKKIGKVFTNKFVRTRPSSYKERIYRAAVSQRLRNTGIEDGWATGPVWTGAEKFAPTGIRSPDRPVRSKSLHRLS
jgi:hypothetical protein